VFEDRKVSNSMDDGASDCICCRCCMPSRSNICWSVEPGANNFLIDMGDENVLS